MNRQDAKAAKLNPIVIPAKAGIHSSASARVDMDSRFRGNDRKLVLLAALASWRFKS